MKTVIIYGQSHKGSTYHIAKKLADKVGGDITEFFLPKDFEKNCIGCTQCFMKGEQKCPHYQELLTITKAMENADLIILASPVYVYHVTGAMKSFLDHYGYCWMVHRPKEIMFKKQAVCISTAAGSGTKSTNKDMADSLFFWGIPKIYKYGVNVHATSFSGISEKTKNSIEKNTSIIANKIKKCNGKVKPNLKTKGFFEIMRLIQKKGLMSPADNQYWQEKGWLESNRPWKNE